MKPWRWSLWVAVAALVVVGLSAAPVMAGRDADLRSGAIQAGPTILQSSNVVFSQPDAYYGGLADSCNDLTWRVSNTTAYKWKQRWYNYVGPNSTGVPIMSFRYDEGGSLPDTWTQLYIHSIAERTNTISQIRLYREVGGAADSTAFYNAGDVLIGVVNVGAGFQTNDSVLMVLTVPEVIPGDSSRYYHLVVDMNAGGIGNNTVYEQTGVMVLIRTERMQIDENNGFGVVWGPNADVAGPCTATAWPNTNNAYSIIIDNQGPECADLSYQFADILCPDLCDLGTATISLGDSIQGYLQMDIVTPASDTNTNGWPKIFVREFSTVSPATMVRLGADYTNWYWEGIAAGPLFDWHNIPADDAAVGTANVLNPLDVNGGFYYLVVEMKDVQGNVSRCSTLVTDPIDTRRPATAGRPASWTLYYDANGNGIANPGDSLRFFVDMTNEPFGEICDVNTTIYGIEAAPIGVTLYDDAGDRRFEGFYEVQLGIADSAANTIDAQLHVRDNACNEDSLGVTLDAPVDNIPPTIPPGEFLRLADTDQNGCLKIGESVRIRVQGVTDPDLVAIYANVMQAGLGDLGGVAYDDYPLANLGGGLWQLDWILGDQPQDSAIDYAANDPNAIVCLYIVDNAQNWDTVYTSYLELANGGYAIDTDIPEPVVDLECQSEAGGAISLSWNWGNQTPNSNNDVALVQIYYDNGTGGDPNILVAEVGPVTSWTTDGTIVLTDGVIYKWTVWTIDDCGNAEVQHPLPVACQSDASAPIVCVFQPEEGPLWSCNSCELLNQGTPNTFYVYVQADSVSDEDIVSIDSCLVRLVDQGDGSPGPWTWVPCSANFQTGSDNTIAVALYLCEVLDGLVGDGDVEDIELILLGADEAGNVATRDEVYAECGGWNFTWANTSSTIDVTITEVNGGLAIYQDYCDLVGFNVWGPGQTAEVCITGGVPPYKIHFEADPEGVGEGCEIDANVIYVENVFAACTTLTFSAENWCKGPGDAEVIVCDASGASSSFEVLLCVVDSIPPCAIISNPVDGKCIRRSRSMIDPETICIEIDPLSNCLDPNEVVKIDFQWAEQCCEGTILDTLRLCDTTSLPGGGTVDCDTFPGGATGIEIDSIVCVDTGFGGFVIRCRDSIVEVPCEDIFEWHDISVFSGDSLFGNTACISWWNTEDLAWITESGTIIYLRGILYDDQGNQFITPCVQVCVDIDTPPLCLWTPDFCWSNGMMSLGNVEEDRKGINGNGNDDITFVAELDLSQANIDDLEDVTLWYKKSSDPDGIGGECDDDPAWSSLGSGFLDNNANVGGTNSTVWRWDIDLDNYNFECNMAYDFRVIAQTIWGTWSYDYNGDGCFDDHTFDSSACDMNTYWIDCDVPQVAIDTVWTTVNGESIVQPNVSCAMSDPRGWAWTQFGNEMTVQPNIYPWTGVDFGNNLDDIARVQWTLWEGGIPCECDQAGGSEPAGSNFGYIGDLSEPNYWVVAINEGENALNNLTFNPADAPWLSVESGYQTVVLHVQVWDSCGNWSEDCITIYLLDVDPTDAIIVDPMDGQVFCTGPGGDESGGITISAASLLEEGWNKAIFGYRAVGATEWVEFDSVGISSDYDRFWQQFNTVWNPVALGLPDGAYELTVWAVDNALNRSENNYVITVYLSCAEPTVAVTHPSAGNPSFLGCDIELEAVAESTDPFNPITSVCFHAIPVIESPDDPESIEIGCDNYSVDGNWGYHWTADEIRNDLNGSSGDGPYYIYAVATNKAGKSVQSEMVWVNIDVTDPWAVIAQVGDDLSDGGGSDPTIIEPGSVVDLWGYARDNMSPWGYGANNNCGVDSVIFYVYNDGNAVAAWMATVDNVIDSLYTAQWNTAGFDPGTYQIYMAAWDCACNDGWSDPWYVVLGNEDPVLSIDGTTICGLTTVDEELNATVTVNDENVNYIYLAFTNVNNSDVEDQYSYQGSYESDDNTWWFSIETEDWADGHYRVRAVVYYDDGSVSEDFDEDGDFDDFTFNADLAHHEVVRVDHGVTPITITPVGGTTFKAHDDICFDVAAEEPCDIDFLSVCSGDVVLSGNSSSFCIDPVDSSCVTLGNCGVWSGTIPVSACDELGHCTDIGVEIWILDVPNANTALIASPAWGSYVTPTSNNSVSARVLSSSGADSVQFYYSTSQTNGTLVYIGSSGRTGDSFSATWNVENVAEGSYWLLARAFDNGASTDGARCVNVTVAKGCTTFTMNAPSSSYQRTVNGQTFTFVGAHTDLCVNRDGISSIANGVGIDSIVFCFRGADAPALTISDNLDPNLGWVRIGADTYGSLCIDWWADWCSNAASMGIDLGCSCSDGRYTVVAWVYDKAGNACHSVPMNVTIDVTDPYSEIVDIDGDETFGECHPILMSSDDVVKISANAIDDHSCTNGNPDAAWNSGAKYLQFIASQCDLSGTCVDVVWVVDGSGSMVNQINNVVSNADVFFDVLNGVDFRMGVMSFTDDAEVIMGDDGAWTTDHDNFDEMLYDALPCWSYYCSEDYLGNQTENGLSALNSALDSYSFRNNCQPVFILVTNEEADDNDDYATLFPPIVSSNAIVFGVIEKDDPTDDGYELLGSATGGKNYDLGESWGASIALDARLASLASANSNDIGIVWGQQVALNDGEDEAFALWNTSGLSEGTYCVWTTVIDQAGNVGTSQAVQVCVIDDRAPVAHIAGFGMSTDEHMNHDYTIYGVTWDSDVDRVQFQYRQTGSSDETAWTGIGLSSSVGNNFCWQTSWNPCALSGSFDLRVVPTDASGNEDFDIQPIATVTISNCGITPSGGSQSDATIWFEDRSFADLGLVNADLGSSSDDFHNTMTAVWADMDGGLEVEKVDLWTPDPDNAAWKSGTFDGTEGIEQGGTGTFWASYTDAGNRTHLASGVVTVWPVRADVGGCSGTDPVLHSKVCIPPNALSDDNGIVVFPARVPVVNLSQQHYQAWPAYENPERFLPLVTAIRLTHPIYGFNVGTYARITIGYADESLDPSDLGVAWWDSDEWNATDGLIAAGEIADGSATFNSDNLYGLYAVVSAGRVCNSGALTVENAGGETHVGNVFGPWPTIYTRVRSNIEFNNRNVDIDRNAITVVLDAGTANEVTLYADGDDSDNDWYDASWDEVTGILTTSWNGPDCWDDYYENSGYYAPALTAGTHTLYVQAFNKSGYCAEDTYTFTVDAAPPDVDVVGYEDCSNPTFHIKITDDGGVGVDWSKVFVDVFDVTGSDFDELPYSKLIHTETYDAFEDDLDTDSGTFSFQLVSHIAQGRRLRIIIYNGERSDDAECGCIRYDHPCDGVRDLVGNNSQIVEEEYTIWGTSCSGGGGGDGGGTITIQVGQGSGNPFDPWAGGVVTFNLQGFDGRGPVSVTVYDLAGVEVADLSPGDISSTAGTVTWNGTNEDAEYVAQGVYLVHFSAPGGSGGGPVSQALKVVVKRGSTASN